jgi:hypothetical protein
VKVKKGKMNGQGIRSILPFEVCILSVAIEVNVVIQAWATIIDEALGDNY